MGKILREGGLRISIAMTGDTLSIKEPYSKHIDGSYRSLFRHRGGGLAGLELFTSISGLDRQRKA